MKRPLHIRLLPDRLKTTAFYRCYNPLPERYRRLLTSATLSYAPTAKMVSLVPGDVISGSIALTGFYELDLTKKISALAKRGGRLLDVGANLGYFSLLWLAQHPKNRCIAIEASPRNIPFLRNNISANGFDDRCRIEDVAAGFENGVLSFDLGPSEQSGWGGLLAQNKSGGVEVPVRRIDSLITDSEEIAVIKIDVEGADTWALMGCERLLKTKQAKLIFFEQHKHRLSGLGIGIDDAQKFLKSHGYRVKAMNNPEDEVVEYVATAD